MEKENSIEKEVGVEAVESARTAYYTQYRKDMAVMVVVCAMIGLGFGLIAVVSGDVFNLFFIVIIVINFTVGKTIVSIKNYKAYGKYERAYKKYFVEGMLKQVFPGCEYRHNGGIKEAEINEMGMMDTGDRYSSEDMIIGEYNGVKFKQADVRIQKEHRDDNGTHYVTVFLGRYAIFDIKKNFSFRLAVIGRGFGLGELRNRDKIKKFKKRTVESAEFHKRFKVYAEDGFEAFYLLDPAIIERIEKLGARYKDKVAVFFYKGFLHVAIKDSSDSFRVPKASKPIEEGTEMGKVREDLKVLTDLVDGLKLVGE